MAPTFLCKFSVFLSLLLIGIQALSQNAQFRGYVRDELSKEPLIGATVRVGDLGTVTDLDGNYALELPAGEYVIEYSFVGYPTINKKIKLEPGESKTLNIVMDASPTLLQTATVTAGKFERPLGEVTVSLEVLKPKLLESNNATSVDEVLDKVPGLTLVGGQANIRGGSGYSYGAGSRVLLLVDDIPALQADAGFPNWDDIPVENIEQIEIVKGAASALYGSSALNGIINVRTSYAKSDPETKISTFYTAYLSPADKEKKWWDSTPFQTGASVAHRQKFNKLDLVTGGYFLKDDNFRESTNLEYGRLTLGIRYRFTDRLIAGFNSNFNRGSSNSYFYWKNGEAGAYRADPATLTSNKRTRLFADPFITYFDRLGNRHKFLGRFYGVHNDASAGRANRSNLYYGEYQFQRHIVSAGLVATAGIVGSGTGVEAELYGDARYTSSNIAGYLQLDKKFFGKLNFSAGLRYERNKLKSPELVAGDTIPDGKTIESKPVFRFGLNYQAGKHTYLRTSWGQGYRFPTVAEKFIFTNLGPTNIIPNPKLTSETGWTAEIAIKQGWKLGNLEGFADIAAYWSEYQDMMEFTIVRRFPLPFQSQNIGNTIIKGFDISIGAKGLIGQIPISLIGGYTFVDPKFKEFGQRENDDSSVDYNILKYRSKHSLKIDVEGEYNGFSLGFAGLYNSHMEAIDAVFEIFINGLKEYREKNNKGFKVFDIRAGYTFRKKLKLSLILKNIFNEEYTVRPALLEAPRNITARADYSF